LAQIGTDWHKFPIFEEFCSSFVRDLFGNGSGLCFKNGILGDDSRRKLPEPPKKKGFQGMYRGVFGLFRAFFARLRETVRKVAGFFVGLGCGRLFLKDLSIFRVGNVNPTL